MYYDKDTIYLIGDAKAPQNNPITEQYKSYFLALVFDRSTGKIVDAECSATIQLTAKFVQSLFVGRRIQDEGLVDEIANRYFGSSQKALIVALKDARKKYNQIFTAALSK
ncbi:hypothetical protein ACH33_17135 [Aneurinibacillus sp. XH2]|uniref:DUF3870 domain-containing protein n=1 Tax=Aneurinibacillus sp. XH2 TaxID=1450761 RepID=UPI00070E6267|nr:DUF3870 domain-containing protein [Aneurinibacillus sp. XH2]AMA74365.1 hypothetical protein ACH33_17135 [Aneurinibacillus sp. XH2]